MAFMRHRTRRGFPLFCCGKQLGHRTWAPATRFLVRYYYYFLALYTSTEEASSAQTTFFSDKHYSFSSEDCSLFKVFEPVFTSTALLCLVPMPSRVITPSSLKTFRPIFPGPTWENWTRSFKGRWCNRGRVVLLFDIHQPLRRLLW